MYEEDDLLPISALQHLAFCERQWGLIHLEGAWAENRLTVEGKHLHERADSDETQVRGDVRIARGLRLRSLRLGLIGRADVVEFHPAEQTPRDTPAPPTGEAKIESGFDSESRPARGIVLPGVSGTWRAVPIEYKRGRVKKTPMDEIQLCAQALCIEEMLGAEIPDGFIFYGKTRRRHPVRIDGRLRDRTAALAARLHDLTRAARTPIAKYEKKCDRCSLYEACLPKTIGKARSVRAYLDEVLREPDPDPE